MKLEVDEAFQRRWVVIVGFCVLGGIGIVVAAWIGMKVLERFYQT